MTPKDIRAAAYSTADEKAAIALLDAANAMERLQVWSIAYWADRIGVMLKLRPMH